MAMQTIEKGWTFFHRFTWAVLAAGFAMGDHAREMHRYAGGHHADDLGFGSGIAGRDQEPEPGAPADHVASS